MNKKYKILLTFPIFFISIQIFIGVLIGYVSALLLSGKETKKQGIIKSIKFILGNYCIHIHHWIIGLSLIPLIIYYNFVFLSNYFVIGLVSGVVCQGFFCYDDWNKILFRIKQ
jgi:uncharacterized membrane protein